MSRRNKGNHRNSRFAFGAQPVPKELSFISFISAGLNYLREMMKYEEIFCATFKAIRKTFDPDEVMRSVDFSIPSMPMVEACRADDFDFFTPIIATGHLTVEQMHHACQRYYLGKTKSGQPIF